MRQNKDDSGTEINRSKENVRKKGDRVRMPTKWTDREKVTDRDSCPNSRTTDSIRYEETETKIQINK